MTKKNGVWCVKNPCRNGVKIEMVLSAFVVFAVESVTPINALI